MQIVERLIGYKRSNCALFPLILLSCVSGGSVWIVIWIAAYLFPQTVLWRMQECSLLEAQYVLAKLINKRQVISKVSRLKLSTKHTGHNDHTTTEVNSFKLLLVTYVYNAALFTFVPLPEMPPQLPAQLCSAARALQAIEQGADWRTLNPPKRWHRIRCQLYGKNEMSAGKPNMCSMVADTLTHPMYLVQYVELAFTFYEEYYWYAAFLLTISLASGYLSTIALYQKRLRLYTSIAQHHLVPYVFEGCVRGMASHKMVPGDIIVLQPGKATCDMVLLQGNCLVDESILSGEAARVRKVSFVPPPDAADGVEKSVAYDPDTHPACTVYAGTDVQQVWSEQHPGEETLAFVVRTGLYTTTGLMLRQVMAPLDVRMFYNDPFVQDLYSFCSFVLVIQLAIFLLYASRVAQHPHSAASVIKRIANVLIRAVPIAIPTVVIFSLFCCMLKLLHIGISVHEPSKIRLAADVEVAVFDKTGTLTGNMPELQGVLPVLDGKLGPLQRSAVQWPNSLKQCAAVCNSLNMISKWQVAGDEADIAAFKACEASFLDPNMVLQPLKLKGKKVACATTLQVLKRFEFEPQLLRSGVLAVDPAGTPDEAVVFIRGAPASIEQIVGKDRVPADYCQVVDHYCGQSFRLMALAKGVLREQDRQSLCLMCQEQLEKHVKRFELLGLLVLSNQLRKDSKPAITELQQKARLRTLMVTGDYHATALAVGRAVGMVPPSSRVIIIQSEKDTSPGNLPVSVEARKPLQRAQDPNAQEYVLQISGQGLSTARQSALSIADQASLSSDSCPLSHQATTPVTLREQEHQRQKAGRSLSLVKELSGGAAAQQSQQQASGLSLHPRQQPHDIPPCQRWQAMSSNQHRGLVFHVDDGSVHQDDALKALTALAQGDAQCCMTGAAFEHMLQLGDQSLLETVMRNVVVFSRMKSHQKGQVMDLLGTKGLHQIVAGQQHHLPGLGKTSMYCGDGINDLVALACADVGVAVGAGDAAAAAVFSTKGSSIGGVPQLLKRCRASQAIKMAAIKFMVLYQLILSFIFSIAYFMDGSTMSYRQRGVLDAVALSLGLVCSLRPSSEQLTARRPHQQLCMPQNFLILTAFVLISSSMYGFYMWFLTLQPWFTGGNGSSYKNEIVTLLWSLALFQVPVAPAAAFNIDTFGFCKPSIPELLLMMMFLCLSIGNLFVGSATIDVTAYFGFYKYPWEFRWKTVAVGSCFFCLFASVLVPLQAMLERWELRKIQHKIIPSQVSI